MQYDLECEIYSSKAQLFKQSMIYNKILRASTGKIASRKIKHSCTGKKIVLTKTDILSQVYAATHTAHSNPSSPDL
jgi:hypothetical protein